MEKGKNTKEEARKDFSELCMYFAREKRRGEVMLTALTFSIISKSEGSRAHSSGIPVSFCNCLALIDRRLSEGVGGGVGEREREIEGAILHQRAKCYCLPISACVPLRF